MYKLTAQVSKENGQGTETVELTIRAIEITDCIDRLLRSYDVWTLTVSRKWGVPETSKTQDG